MQTIVAVDAVAVVIVAKITTGSFSLDAVDSIF